MLPILSIPNSLRLPDSDQWQFRFQIKSATSNPLYTVAQHKKNRYWGCDCPGWKATKRCKHLRALGLPTDMKPFEVNLVNA